MNKQSSAKLRGIHKIYKNRYKDEYNDTTALKNITIEFVSGEIHALLGENGAGKSTLVHILAGQIVASKGSILVDEKCHIFKSPRDAIHAGLGIVHQQPMLVQDASVFENILLGTDRPFFINRKKAFQEVQQQAREWQIDIDLNGTVKNLNTKEKFFVALLSALYHKPSFLILDEPTVAFSFAEQKEFFDTMHKVIRKNHIGVIFISHSIAEALNYADKISVLRCGNLVKTFETNSLIHNVNTAFETIETTMVPNKSINSNFKAVREPLPKEQPFFSIDNLSLQGTHDADIKNCSFSVAEGRLVGIIGTPNSGLYTLEDALSGLSQNQQQATGLITIAGKSVAIKNLSTTFLHDQQIAIIPSDRYNRASNPELSLFEALLPPFCPQGFFSPKKLHTQISDLVTKAEVDALIERPCASLSGGELQRCILQRELTRQPKLLLLASPEQGLDFERRKKLQQKIRTFADNGISAIILIKEIDYEEYHHFFDYEYFLKQGEVLACQK